VSGFARLRGYLYEGPFLSDDFKTIRPGGSDEEILGEILGRYRQMMFRIARSITNNEYDADDVIQRLCIRFVINGIPDGLRENPPAYLIGCIVNEAKNVHRNRDRQPIDRGVKLQDLEDIGYTSENKLLEALEEAQACLTPEEREVVELFYTQGLTQADIAKVKEMEEDAVAQKLSRSRKKMKKVISIGRTSL
jgi:RNA polymerase sigma factor (sigma-70 family)